MAGERQLAVCPLTPEEEAFFRAWSRAMLTVPRALDADLIADQGMSLSDYATLMHLSEAPERTLRMSDLALATALSVSSMSRIVARLEAHGLVRRERALCDGRGLNAQLTDAGLARLESAWPTHLDSVKRHLIDHLGGLDLAEVTAAIQQFASDQTSLAEPHIARKPPR